MYLCTKCNEVTDEMLGPLPATQQSPHKSVSLQFTFVELELCARHYPRCWRQSGDFSLSSQGFWSQRGWLSSLSTSFFSEAIKITLI